MPGKGAARIAKGLCAECGSTQRSPLPGKTRCARCNDRHAAKQIERGATRRAEMLPSGGSWYKYHADLAVAECKALVEKFGGRCVDCGKQCTTGGSRKDLFNLGHIVPKSKGGKSIPQNLVGQCGSCNAKLHDKFHWTFMTAACVGLTAQQEG